MVQLRRHVPGGAPGRTILGHPAGLFVLFFTEMWERFSYYGMRSLLVLYMVDHLFLHPEAGQRVLGFGLVRGGLEAIFGPLAPQPLSSQIYGLYTAFVYLTPFFGGMLADRVIGRHRAVILGAVLMAIGHFLMAVESLFFPALLFLILGNGAFKPNIRHRSEASTLRVILGGTAPSRSSTWGSTSERSSPRSYAARSANGSDGTTVSAPPASAWSRVFAFTSSGSAPWRPT